MVRGTLCIAAVLERLWVISEMPTRSNEPHRDVVMSVFDVLMWLSPFSVVVKFVLGPLPHLIAATLGLHLPGVQAIQLRSDICK
jgi:hypothetical protein